LSYGQLLLTQRNNSIEVIDLHINAVSKVFDNVNGRLTGYSIVKDSVLCYVDANGIISVKPFAVKELNQPVPKIKKADYLQQLKVDTSIIIADRGKLIINGYSIAFCSGQQRIWNRVNKISNIDCSDTFENKGNPNWLSVSINPDRTALLYVAEKYNFIVGYSKIYQVDVKTGSQKYLTRGSGPSYSPDGQFILYKKQFKEEFGVMSKAGSAVRKVDLLPFNVAYWIYESIGSPELTTHPTLSSNVKFMNFYPFNDIETISPPANAVHYW
jgi:hypothetical protein